jgi:hypothetical protein
VRVLLLTLCAPIAMALFLLVMQRLEAALLPARPWDAEPPPAPTPSTSEG